jgi:glycosyltransferase involved in cell wall biosynthesis
MRIAMLSVSAEMGGSEAVLVELFRGLRRLAPGIRPLLVVPREGTLAARARDLGAEVHSLPMPDALADFGEWSLRGAGLARRGAAFVSAAGAATAYQRTLTTLLSELRPDVIHTNGFKMHVLGTRAAPAGVPVVWHLHEYVARRPLSRRLLRHHAPRAAAIVANSRSVAVDVARAVGTTVPVTTIYNAVDLQVFSPSGGRDDLDSLAQMPPAGPGTLRVGLVATFARWKGHEVFLRALAALRAPDVRGYVIGGPLYDTAGSQYSVDELRAAAAAMGLQDRVGFTGFVASPAAAMRALDIVVHASTEPEPFGLAIAEGLACGKPVILSAAGGAAELVEAGSDALTVAPGDHSALAQAIARCASDPGLRVRLGAAARKSALRRFDPDVFTRAFIDVYERAAERAAAVTSA